MKSFIALLLLSYIALAICQTPVAAPTSRVGDGRARTIKFFKAPGAIGVKAVAVSKMAGMTDLDAIVAGASLQPLPTMAFSYFTSEMNATEDMTSFTSGRFSFAFRIVGLIEYVESGANAGYQSGEDTQVSYYSLRKELIGWDTETSADNGQVVHTATASTKDGVIVFTLAFAGNRTVFENRTLNGDNFKFSVTIDYSKAPKYSGRNDTSLALITVAAAKKAVKDIQNMGQSGSSVEVPSDDQAIVGKLMWDGQVTAMHSGKNASFNLVSTVDSTLRNDSAALNVTTGWTSQVVYHSVTLEGMSIGNSQLYWDPELGADIDYDSLDASPSTSSPSTSSPSTSSPSTSSPSTSAPSRSGPRSGSSALIVPIAVVISALLVVLA